MINVNIYFLRNILKSKYKIKTFGLHFIRIQELEEFKF